MKKLFTPENYMTGILSILLALVIYTAVDLIKQGHYVFVLGLPTLFLSAFIVGYFINKLANKYIK